VKAHTRVNSRWLFALTVLGFLCSTMCLSVHGDELYARIRGVVTDQTGASVAGATVITTNTATGISRTLTTATDGNYEFLALPIGPYTVVIEKSSFKKFAATGITLAVNQIYVLNATLEVGQVSAEVTVMAAPAQVESTSMQLGIVITGQQIVDAPLAGRNFVDLQATEPGVVGSGSDRFGPDSNGTNFSTNGSQSQQNSYLINGVDSADIALNTINVVPSLDAIAEFQLVTSTINPEFGRNSGAILNALIKSGTNGFHGDAFEFFRDTSLNGRSFFQKKPSIFHQNDFGGTIGGPVWKNHTFFFFSYEGRRFSRPQLGYVLPTVGTTAQQNGDFSASSVLLSASANSSPIPLFGDSASPCPVSSGTPCAAQTPYAKLFSTNVIPSADFNTVSANLTKTYLPAPNFTGNQFTFNPVEAGKEDQYLFRIDHTFNAHDTIWEYSLFESDPLSDTLPFQPIFNGQLPGFAQTQQQHTKEYSASWLHTFTGTTLNEFRAGFQRLNFVAVQPQTPILPSKLGFTGINPQNTAQPSVPTIAVAGADVTFAMGFSDFGPQPRVDQVYEVGDNFSHLYKNHTLKFGFEGRRFEVRNPFYAQNNGQFAFNGAGPLSTGNPMADFLLGFPDGYTQGSGNIINARAYEYYSYAQDQWKVRPNLTITFGTGWDIETPMTNFTNHKLAINCFTANQPSTVFPTAPTGLLFPGDKGCSASGYHTHYYDFAPRVGFAWTPHLGRISGAGKLSIRGGFGIYYNRSEEELTLQVLTDPPFAITDFGIGDVGGAPSFIAPFTDARCITQTGAPISSPFCSASGSIPNKYPFSAPKPGTAVDFTFFEPFGLATMDPNFRSPYAENFNLTVERELPGQTILSIAYVGALGHHLETWFERNPGAPGGCANNAACASSPFNAFKFPQFFRYNSLIFGSIGTIASMNNSNYNSLQISANKHLSHGLIFLASYTYSHSLDWSSSFEDQAFGPLGTDPFNFKRFYGNSSFDDRHRLAFSSSYDLPKLPGTANHALVDRAVNGWRVSLIAAFQTGVPVQIANNAFGLLGTTSGTCPGLPETVVSVACWDAPNVSGPIHTMDPRASKNHLWFDPTLFSNACTPAAPAAGCTSPFNPETGGNAGRNIIHGPGINNWDFQLTKQFPIRESVRMELRAEVFNIFNHAQFGNPDGNLADGASFGRISRIHGLPRIAQLAAKFYF
jgi:hypothetical protein